MSEYVVAGMIGALVGAIGASAALLVLAFGWPRDWDRHWWR